jgi:hypothetical protein
MFSACSRNGIERQIARKPHGTPFDEAFHILPAYRRKIGAIALLIEVEKPVPMTFLLLRHLLEDLCRRRIALLQILREGHINAGVFLLCGDRHRQNLTFGQVCEFLRRVHQSGKHDPELLRTILSAFMDAGWGCQFKISCGELRKKLHFLMCIADARKPRCGSRTPCKERRTLMDADATAVPLALLLRKVKLGEAASMVH